MKKYGFIYIWFDKKHYKYYLGRHWGFETDGYICSSRMMRQSYNRRPNDFKRRIISRVYTLNHDLILEEQRWLDMINSKDLGIRYYNKSLRADSPTNFGNTHTEQTKKRMSDVAKGRQFSDYAKQKQKEVMISRKQSNEEKQKRSKSMTGKTWKVLDSKKMGLHWKDKTLSKSHKQKISNSNLGKLHSEESKKKIGEANKKNYNDTVLVVNRHGKILRINTIIFHNQKHGDPHMWEYVGIASKEAKIRRQDV